jgi:hypothetical protein
VEFDGKICFVDSRWRICYIADLPYMLGYAQVFTVGICTVNHHAQSTKFGVLNVIKYVLCRELSILPVQAIVAYWLMKHVRLDRQAVTVFVFCMLYQVTYNV